MLARKLDIATLKQVRARADFFFEEQLKRLGPLPGAEHLHADAHVSSPPVFATPRRASQRKPKQPNPTE